MKNKNYPRLISDIGGINARFHLEIKPYVYEKIHTLSCNDYTSLIEAVGHYLSLTSMMGKVKSIILVLPNSEHNDIVSVVDSLWPNFSIKEASTAFTTKFGMINVVFINDWHAIALSLPLIPKSELIKFEDDNDTDESRPKIAIGPGTELELATLIRHPQNGEYLSMTSEGAHSSFCPITEEEQSICKYALTKYDHVSAERFISDHGIKLIYEALSNINNITFNEAITSEEIIQKGTTSDDILCKKTVDTFCEMLGSFTGNFAVLTNSFGGVYLSGNIISSMTDYFINSGFKERFQAKGRYRGFLEKMPIYIVTTKHPTLLGASYALDQYLESGYIP